MLLRIYNLSNPGLTKVAYYCADSEWSGRAVKLAKIQKDHPSVKIFTESELRKLLSVLPLVAKPPLVVEDAPAFVVEEEKKDLQIIASPAFKPQQNGHASTPEPKRQLARSAPNTPNVRMKSYAHKDLLFNSRRPLEVSRALTLPRKRTPDLMVIDIFPSAFLVSYSFFHLP
jgi:hypothetical protein